MDHGYSSDAIVSILLLVESLSECTAQKMKPIVGVLASLFANPKPVVALNSVLSLNAFLTVSFQDIIY